ncbi:MAG: hypothetical protein RR718_10765, partial [Comamonas sp.]
MQIQSCALAGAPDDHAPRVWLAQGLDAADREQARLQARAALCACLVPELDCSEDELGISNLRNQAPQLLLRGKPLALPHCQKLICLADIALALPHCSISHAPGLALLARHWQGPVGVDIQALDTTAPRHELAAVARLFLDQKAAQALIDIPQEAHFLEAFANAWTRHEARLKCAGLGLVEWS